MDISCTNLIIVMSCNKPVQSQFKKCAKSVPSLSLFCAHKPQFANYLFLRQLGCGNLAATRCPMTKQRGGSSDCNKVFRGVTQEPDIPPWKVLERPLERRVSTLTHRAGVSRFLGDNWKFVVKIQERQST